MRIFKQSLLADCLNDGSSFDDPCCDQADQVVVTCESFETRVNDLLDNRTDLLSDPAVQLHADECLKCRQTLQQYQQLELALGGVLSGSVDDSLVSSSDAGRRREFWRKSASIVTPVASLVCWPFLSSWSGLLLRDQVLARL